MDLKIKSQKIIMEIKSRKCSHQLNRKTVCATCGSKIVLGGQKYEYFNINSLYLSLIQKFINANFDLSSSNNPLSICTTCRLTLREYEKNICKRPLPCMPNYEEMQLIPESDTDKDQLCN